MVTPTTRALIRYKTENKRLWEALQKIASCECPLKWVKLHPCPCAICIAKRALKPLQ